MKMVKLTWLDSSAGGPWNRIDDIKKERLATCTTVGMVLREDEESITVVQSFDGAESVDHFIVIPKFAIVKRKNLR